ncbi:MAG: primosomal protein N' [Clostridia bacterium]|jgi:primosomal protein N' (replication factor Y)
MKVASVVLSNSTRKFDKEYDYIIPENLINEVSEGIRVIVPFGNSNRSVEGYVFKLKDTDETDKLKSIKKVVDKSPVLNEDMINLVRWMKDRYVCCYKDAIRCMIPPGTGADSKTKVKEKIVKNAFLNITIPEALELVEGDTIKKIQQIRVIELLMENDYIPVSDLVRFSGVSRSVMETLSKKGYIEFKDIETNREPNAGKIYESSEPMLVNSEQDNVLKELIKSFEKNKFEEFLIHGVTGSGKTEIYMQMIKHCCDAGKQSIVLVPEISLTPQMIERFKGRFGSRVAVIHSKLSLGERFDQWRLIRDGKVDIAVGARSAVFAPFDNLGLIIIDEEHENTYKSEITPKYHAKEIAKERLKSKNGILIYGSATPSVETYYYSKNGDIKLQEMNFRVNKMNMPAVKTIDMRKELENGNRSMFSDNLITEIRKNIDEKQQTILFLNKRGSASFVLCRACGLVMRCPNCNISLTYHSHNERLICHYCGFTVKNPKACPKCGSNYIKHFGTGTQKVEEEIKKQFPDASVIRMDLDTTTGKNSHEEILTSFKKDNINILIGTQMIAKGLDFPNVTLVGILAADSMLNTGDFRASERTFQLITQVSGRAGRGKIPGRVIIQTYNDGDFSINAACGNDYRSFYETEISLREKLAYPPFTNIAIIIVSGIDDKAAYDLSVEIKNEISDKFKTDEDSDVLGPARSPLSKIKNKYRWRIVLKCSDKDRIISIFENVSKTFEKKSRTSKVAFSMDINPVNML